MAEEKSKDPIAQAMAEKRWAKTTAKQRSEVAKRMNEARWGSREQADGPAAKRPASGKKRKAK